MYELINFQILKFYFRFRFYHKTPLGLYYICSVHDNKIIEKNLQFRVYILNKHEFYSTSCFTKKNWGKQHNNLGHGKQSNIFFSVFLVRNLLWKEILINTSIYLFFVLFRGFWFFFLKKQILRAKIFSLIFDCINLSCDENKELQPTWSE